MRKYSPWDNITYGANPFDWSRGPGDKAGGMFDPFNLTGWNTAKKDSGGDPYAGMPGQPQYQQVYDPSMALTPGLDERLNGIQMDKSGLNAFRDQALRKGPSSWATLAKKDQAAQAANAREKGAREIRGQTAQAEDALASRGGLSSGARERTAQEGAKNYLAMSQDTARQENLNDLQIGMNDEQNRIQQLGMLPGMEYQAIQPDLQKSSMWEQARQADLANTTAENDRRNQWNQILYQQQMQSWAANRQAQATENSGKK